MLHFISFHFISYEFNNHTQKNKKPCWLYHFISRKPQGVSWLLTPPWVRFCSVTLSWQGPVVLHPQKSRQQSLEASNDPEAIVFSLGALPNLFGVSFNWLWFILTTLRKKSRNKLRLAWWPRNNYIMGSSETCHILAQLNLLREHLGNPHHLPACQIHTVNLHSNQWFYQKRLL